MNTQPKLAILVGVDHRIQYTNANCGPEWRADIRAFEDHLVELARAQNVELVAEEFSDEYVRRNCATGCTVRDAAQRAGRRHLFCDPDNVERAEHGIASDDKREMEWLRRIVAVGPDRLLMVCGDDHVDSFSKILHSAGYHVIVESRKWGIDWAIKDC